MTGYADFAELDAGTIPLPILKKPFRLEELGPALQRLLRERSDTKS
jgi:hypothetical protein